MGPDSETRDEPASELLTLVLTSDGRYLKANSRAIDVLRLDSRTYIGKPATAFFHCEDRSVATELLRRIQKTRSVTPFRFSVLSPEGEELPILWSGVVLDDGRMVGSGVVLNDEDAADVLAGPKGLQLSRKRRTARVDGQAVRFTAAEFNIIEALLKDRGVVVSAAELARQAFGYEEPGLNWNFLQAHMSRIRKKLRPYGADDVIEAVRGIGYVCR